MSGIWIYDWAIWASLAIGLTVTGLVFGLGKRWAPRRRHQPGVREEDLPWDELLPLLTARYAGKSAADEKLSSDDLMDLLLKDLPKTSGVTEDDANWVPGAERRKTRRRWANPVEVAIVSPFHNNLLHGLVINRSTGGLAILTDLAFAPDTVLSVRAIGVPPGVKFVTVKVRHAREVSKLWIIGCEYTEDVPWNVKIWLG